MQPGFRVVVSAENNPYMAWQAKLFHYSCVSYLRHTPIIVVHDREGREGQEGQPWAGGLHPFYKDILHAGGIVHPAPGYRTTRGGFPYPPRNTAGTLLHARAARLPQDAFFVLCDADHLFVEEPEFPEVLSANRYQLGYAAPAVEQAAAQLGVSYAEVLQREPELSVGSPHVVPVEEAERLGRAWLDAIDAFPADSGWLISMHALGLAVVKLGLRMTPFDLTTFNYRSDDPVTRPIIHYCQGDRHWAKARIRDDEQIQELWDSVFSDEDDETVLGQLLRQVQEAREYYEQQRCHSRLLPPLPPGTVYLHAAQAHRHGRSLRLESGFIGYWTDPADYLTWHLRPGPAVKMRVEVRYACAPGCEGSRFRVGVPGGAAVPGRVEATGGWTDFTPWVSVGELALPAGRRKLELRVQKMPGPAVMNLLSVRLVPVLPPAPRPQRSYRKAWPPEPDGPDEPGAPAEGSA